MRGAFEVKIASLYSIGGSPCVFSVSYEFKKAIKEALLTGCGGYVGY